MKLKRSILSLRWYVVNVLIKLFKENGTTNDEAKEVYSVFTMVVNVLIKLFKENVNFR